MKKVLAILGTRPEAIKLAPVILALKADSRYLCVTCSTGQHKEMLKQVLDVFDISPDIDLSLMKDNQTLSDFTARALEALDRCIAHVRPDIVIVQGDTTTVFTGALAAFYNKIPVAHVEAGLRTNNLYSPWPEEANRTLVSRLAYWHFAPTDVNKNNLLAEGISADRVFVTGNTVIDALMIARRKIERRHDVKTSVLITSHRRENFGVGMTNICLAIKRLAMSFPNVDFIFPVHLNPNVRKPVFDILGQHECNVKLIDPQDYLAFVTLMERATIILTDSGGVQEEAPSLGKPVLVMRDTTERPEAVNSGNVRLVGTDVNEIVKWVSILLTNKDAYSRMSSTHNPYGDGNASQRIVDALQQ